MQASSISSSILRRLQAKGASKDDGFQVLMMARTWSSRSIHLELLSHAPCQPSSIHGWSSIRSISPFHVFHKFLTVLACFFTVLSSFMTDSSSSSTLGPIALINLFYGVETFNPRVESCNWNRLEFGNLIESSITFVWSKFEWLRCTICVLVAEIWELDNVDQLIA